MLKHLRRLEVLVVAALMLWPQIMHAQIMTSTDYTLNTNVSDSFGGLGSSTDYELTDTGGDAINGAGASPSYMLGQGYVRTLPQSIELTVLPSGTYAYWPFDTGTGDTAYDMSTNGDNGTLQNSPSWTTGIVGDAVTYNGSNQYMTTSNQVAAPNSFTMGFWFKSTTNSGGYLMGFGSGATGASSTLDRLVYLNNSGQIVFGLDPAGTDVTLTTSSSYNDGSWHYVAATLGSGGMQLYVDGIRQGLNAAVTSSQNYNGYWRIGYDNLSGWPGAPSSNYAAATIDEARVYSRQLSSTEVNDDFTAGDNGLNNAFTLPNITPGQSQTYSVDAVVRTDAPAYDLYMQEPNPLSRTGGGATFPAISGTIASPIPWVEGTTKGFGFTLTSGYDLESSWGTSPNYDYAAVPSTSTVFHARPGTSQLDGAAETTTIQYRADAAPTQEQGTYTTEIIYTATMVP